MVSLSDYHEQKNKEYLAGVKAYLQSRPDLQTRIRRMLEQVEDLMKHCEDVVWDTDREPVQPGCRVCGNYFFIRRPDGTWDCSQKRRHKFMRTWSRQP